MKYISEKTGKTYDTADECLKAEKAYDKAVAEEKARKEKLTSERKERALEVENAYKAVLEAQKLYHEKLDAFIKDYKSFHMTIHDSDTFGSLFKDLWSNLF